MFLPTTREEMNQRGWDRPDIILVTGDSYIDSPFIGVAVIGRVLERAGFRVGIVAQPDIHSERDITRLGEPRLFWGVSGGSVDSMVANYTALKKKRKSDDYTPGGINDRRPDRATIIYANLIRRFFKHTRPIVLGGIEASLRRIAHYDFWSDRVRGSILLDAKADYLLYGMAEKSAVELAECLNAGREVRNIRGLSYIGDEAAFAG
ncbi:MAG: YgiQ family radical SAM protein, partial [Chloroflexi bacterium]|nr:YgiQ family radical SAM protein [Chloroflexota bacterium]